MVVRIFLAIWVMTSTSWGEGLSVINGHVSALTRYKGDLYVGGSFGVLKRSDRHWESLAPFEGGGVTALASFQGRLIVSGAFTKVAGVSDTKGLAAYNGSSWVSIGKLSGESVSALAPDGAHLFIAGKFAGVDGISSPGLISWDGNRYRAPITNVELTAGDITLLEAGPSGVLFVGGDFALQTDDGEWVQGVGTIAGGKLGSLGGGVYGAVQAMHAFGGRLYVAGNFTRVGQEVRAIGVAVWDGHSWSELHGGGSSDYGFDDILAPDSGVYVSGSMNRIGEHRGAITLAHLSGGAWQVLSRRATTYKLFSDQGSVFGAGNFAAGQLTRLDDGEIRAAFPGRSGPIRTSLPYLDGELLSGAFYEPRLGSTRFHLAFAPAGEESKIVRLGEGLVPREDVTYVADMVATSSGVVVHTGPLPTSFALGRDPAAVSNMFRFDGTMWHALPSARTEASGMVAYKGDIYMGGELFMILTGGVWKFIEGGLFPGKIHGTDDYIFMGNQQGEVRRWDGKILEPLGERFSGQVGAVTSIGADPVVSVIFLDKSDWSFRSKIYRFVGTEWELLHEFDDIVENLASMDGKLLIGLMENGPYPTATQVLISDLRKAELIYRLTTPGRLLRMRSFGDTVALYGHFNYVNDTFAPGYFRIDAKGKSRLRD